MRERAFTPNVELILDAKSQLGEGPSWDERNRLLYWVDILRKQIHTYQPETGKDKVVQLHDYISSVIPARSGGVVGTLSDGFYRINPRTGHVSSLGQVEKDSRKRFNDGKCDVTGRYWAGTMSIKEKVAVGALYCLEPGGKIRKVLSGITVSNGLGWSPDNKSMYYIDSPTKKIQVFNYEVETGMVKVAKVVDFSAEQGVPDGMAVDIQGMIWVAHWGGAAISRWNPSKKKRLEVVPIPATHTSSCCFGGKNLDELFVTTAREGLNRSQLALHPHSGGLFKVRVGIKGLPTNHFDG